MKFSKAFFGILIGCMVLPIFAVQKEWQNIENQFIEKSKTRNSQFFDQPIIVPQYNMEQYDREMNQIYKTVLNNPNDSIEDRIAKASQYFLGKSYLLGALGEGPTAKFDQEPLYRTDAFDCTTYVETVLGLAQAKNLQQFKSIIRKIRYQNQQATFVDRNHFISVDWNLKNERNGYMRDITDQLGVPYKVAVATIDKPNWYRKKSANNLQLLRPVDAEQTKMLLDQWHNEALKVTIQTGKIKYIPLKELFFMQNGQWEPNQEFFNKIPSVAIIEIVFPNHDLTKEIGTHLNVLHMGLIVRTKQGLMFRQASEHKGQIVDLDLVTYLSRIYPYAVKYSAGINIQEPTTPQLR